MTSFIEFVLLGLCAGGVYTLISLSVVVVYRGSGIINFASGGIALLGASLYYELGRYMSTGPAVALSVLLCAIFGALIQVLVMRPMRNTAPLTKVVATLATMTILSSAGALRYGTNGNLLLVPSFLPNGAVQIGPVAVGEDRIICLAIGLVAVAGLHLLYRYTPFGRAATGVSENERAVAALGWSPGRIALVNWSVGSALAGLAGILFVPIVGFSVSSIVLIILPALSAALVGNFVSFPLAFCGAELVGVLQSLSTKYISTPGWTNAVPFLVIVVLLVVRGRALLLRGHMFDKLPRIGAAEIRWPRLIGFVALVIISLSVFTGNWSQAVTTTAVYALICLSLVVVTGYAGQLSLAQYAFAGVGALTSTRLAQVFGVPFIVALPAGVAVAVATGLLVAIPAFRVRGANLAVVTLGLAQVITSVLLGNPAYTGGVDVGTVIKSPTLFGWNISAATNPRAYALVALGLLCLCAFMVRNIRRGTTGRRLLAVRSNERAALSIGISVTGAKLYAFGTSAGLAAVAGVLLGFQYTNVDFTQFSVLASVQAVLYAVLGGIGFISGSLQGGAIAPNGVIQQILDHWVNLNSAKFGLIAAAVLIPTIIMNRDGIAAAMSDSWEQLRGWLVKRIPGLPARWRERRAPRPAAGLPRDAAPVAYRVAPKALKIRDLSVRYGGTAALSGLSLTVNPGEVVGLIGANGAGKTTAIDAASGMTAAESGEIWLGDTRIDGLTARKRARAGLVRSFQSLELFDDLTVSENLRAATDSRDVWRYFQDLFWPKKPPLPDTVKSVISAFELEPWLDRMPDELPYAQRRLVGIARAVASGPSVLMLDEPASGLDAASTAELAGVVRTLADEWGMAVLLVEHDVAMVLETSDRIYAIDFGSLIGTGRPDEIRRDEKVNSAYFGADEGKAEYEPAGAGSVAMSATARGPAAHNGSVNGSSAAPPPLLEARGLYSGYGAIPVIRDINIRVGRGEVVALLGANGAGKTTTLLTLAGVLSPSAGSVESQGTTLLRSSLDRRCRQGLGVVFEERGIIPSLSTADNLRLGRGGVDAAVALFPELEGLLSRRAGLLSGGEQQILTVARALAASPDIILVDELSLGLAPKIVERLLRGIRAAVDQNKLGVLLVEQRIHTALRFADRAAIIRRGEIVFEDEAEALRGNASRIAEHYFAAT